MLAEQTGLEPATFRLTTGCATNCATAPYRSRSSLSSLSMVVLLSARVRVDWSGKNGLLDPRAVRRSFSPPRSGSAVGAPLQRGRGWDVKNLRSRRVRKVGVQSFDHPGIDGAGARTRTWSLFLVRETSLPFACDLVARSCFSKSW